MIGGMTDDKSGYMKYILAFGIIFTILQVSDLVLTDFALKSPGIRELNPLYSMDLFIPFKLTMVFLIMYIMYRQPARNREFARSAMSGIIAIYLLINLNNLYFVLSN